MPLINPGPSPTWAEVQAGIEANEAERTTIDAAIDAANADIQAAELVIRTSRGTVRQIDNNLRKWLRAIRVLAGDD